MDQERKHSIELLCKAKRALDASDFSGAIEVCLQALAEDADALECSLLLGYAYLGKKMLNQSSEAFRKARHALEALPEDRERYLSCPVADIQHASSITNAGPLYLENGSTLAYSVWLGLFEVTRMQGDLMGQIESLEQLIQILAEEDPRDSTFRVHLAKNYSLVGEFEKSVQQFRHALESLPVGSEERLDTLCSAADVLIQNDAKTAEVEVEAELDTKGREDPGRSVSCIKLDVLAAHAAHDEEKDGSLSINHVLLEIVESAPAALRYLPYREEYLQRCLLKIFHHPPRSTERQQLRLAALKECVGVICNGGPCSCLAYEAAVWLLEEEEEITGGQVSVGGQEVGGMKGLAGGVQAGAEGHIGLGRQATVAFAVENFSRRMFHQFPTNATAQVLLTLMLRRHAFLSKHPVPQLERRKWEELLENAMLDDADVDCASGFKALAELHYENRNYQKAHDASLRGLRWLQQRRDRGHEALTQVGLGLRLVLAKSLRRLDRLDEAERQFKALAGWVSEGEIAFAEMCGSAPTSIHQQALRGLALVAVARGDHDAALSQYERILGKAALGRGPAEHWAHADYGWLLFQDGDLEHAKSHLEQAVEVSEEEGCSATDSQVGEHRYRLGEVYWSMGGKYQANKQFSYSMFLEASKVEGHAQAAALASLGRYYDVIENNHSIAQRCYKKALDIDPSTKIAGKYLCLSLQRVGHSIDSVIAFCSAFLDRYPTAVWCLKESGKAYMKLDNWRKAATLFMKHIQLSPGTLSSWEELGIAYYKLDKYTSAMKSFKKALSGKKPGIRSQIFLALTLSSLGNITESLSIFENLLQKDQGSIIMLLYSKLILSFASWNLRRGASHNAFTLAKRAAVFGGKFVKEHGNNSMGHKVVGDANFLVARLMHISIISRESISKVRTMSLLEQLKMSMQSACRSFSKAVHLHPNSSPAWRDLAVTLSTWPINNKTSVSLADRCLGSGIRLSPINGICWKELALAWASRNETKALYGLKRALLLSKNDCESWVAFACLLKGQAIQNLRGYALQQGLQSGSDDLYHWHTLYINETKSISYEYFYRKQSRKSLALSCLSRTDFLSLSLNELRLSPVDTVFLNGWGLALARSGNWTAAANAHMFTLLTEDLGNSEDRTCYFLSRALTAVKYHNEEENRVFPLDPVLFLILNILSADNKNFSIAEAVKSDVLSLNQDSDSILHLDAILCLLRSKHLSYEEFYLLVKETLPGSILNASIFYPAMDLIERFRFLYAEVWEQFGKPEVERALKAFIDNDAVGLEAFELVKADAKRLLEFIADLDGLRLRLKGSVDRAVVDKKFAKVLHVTPWLQAKDVLIALEH